MFVPFYYSGFTRGVTTKTVLNFLELLCQFALTVAVGDNPQDKALNMFLLSVS